MDQGGLKQGEKEGRAGRGGREGRAGEEKGEESWLDAMGEGKVGEERSKRERER